MCGIFCFLSKCKELEYLFESLQLFETQLRKRGPDSFKTELVQIADLNLLFGASVLWLQGQKITPQPLRNEESVFVYNGDIFGGIFSENSRIERGDTDLLFEELNKTSDISNILHNIEGPYAFIFLDYSKRKLYFGRDNYGRRSLLIGHNLEEYVITSVAKRNTKFNFIELPSIGTFCLDLMSKTWQLYPWKSGNKNFEEKLKELENFLKIQINVESVNLCNAKSFVAPNSDNCLQFEKILNCSETSEIFNLLSNIWSDNITKLHKLLKNAVENRISTQPHFCQNCFNQKHCNHATIGILFSGGLDCAVLALFASQLTDPQHPIDLINVAFDEPNNYQTPDRLTGLATLKELQKLCPDRNWNFVPVNVTRDDLDFWRSNCIADLIYPLKSILDDSLGCALWFASRGKTNNYTSPARVLLVGMGADELFGGYTRHRAAFQKRSWLGLHHVLEEDWQNLPYRNLARDDRVISDHGRQIRTPFLDEDVVKFVRNLHCWERTYPSQNLPHGVGEKILLRTLAYNLGLLNAATFKKRAIQFGSRIANPKEKAHEISLRL